MNGIEFALYRDGWLNLMPARTKAKKILVGGDDYLKERTLIGIRGFRM